MAVPSRPYTSSEIEQMKELFRGMPTCFTKDGDHYIQSSDFPELGRSVGLQHTPEQMAAYQEHINSDFGGVVSLTDWIKGMKVLHNTPEFGKVRASFYDTDGDGFISEEEFIHLMQMMVAHEPKLTGTSYKEFMEQADSNKDGRISIEECGDWIQKNLS